MVCFARVSSVATSNSNAGPVVRIAPKTVLVSDPNTIRRVLGVNSRYMRGPWFDSLRIDPHTTSVVSERDPKKHQQLRHILAGGLSGKDVPGVEAIIDLHVVKWMYALSQKANSSQDGCFEIDLSRVIPFLSMDISTHLCLGETFGNVETDRDKHGLLKALSMGMVAQQYIASLLELKTTLFWFGSLSFLRERIFPTAKRPTGIGEVMRVCIMFICRHYVDADLADHTG
jgi:cytochrome P450